MLLSIDPGVSAGWALFGAGKLVRCGSGFPEVTSAAVHDDIAIIEHPVIYPGGRTKDPNAIVKLAFSAGKTAGALYGMGWAIRTVLPREWKGTLDPDICCARVWGRLDAEEQHVVNRAVLQHKIASSKRHNLLDAIGIGLFQLGRWTARPTTT